MLNTPSTAQMAISPSAFAIRARPAAIISGGVLMPEANIARESQR